MPVDIGRGGYRLPTRDEWMYAARGGLRSKLFPWGDTISHAQANYYAYPGDKFYDYAYGGSWGDYGDCCIIGGYWYYGWGAYSNSGFRCARR